MGGDHPISIYIYISQFILLIFRLLIIISIFSLYSWDLFIHSIHIIFVDTNFFKN